MPNAYIPGGGVGGVGVAFSAGTASQSTGTIVFSNSNGISFGLNNGTITATVTPGAAAGIAAVQLPNTTYTSGTANFINSNGVSFGSSGAGGITASIAAATAFLLSASNGLTFGTNGSTVTGSYSQSTAAFSASGGSSTFGTLPFANSNGVTFSNSAGSVVASYNSTSAVGQGTTFAGTNVSASMTLNTAGVNLALSAAAGGGGGAAISAAGSSQNAGTIVFSNSNGLAFGMNGSTVTGSYSQSAQAFSASGGSSTFSTLNFANSNGVTFSNSAGSVVVSYNSTSAAGQGSTFAGTNISGSMTVNSAGINLALSGAAAANPNISAGTTSGNLGSIVFSNSNGISFGLNGSTITASASGAGASATVLAQSQTTGQSSSGTLALSALNVAGYGVVSVGMSAGTLQISGPGTTNFANLSVSAGTTSGSIGSVVFSNSNGVSFGLNGSTITGSIAAQTNQTEGFYALGNTTGQSSSSTFDARTVSISGLGNVSVGYSGNALVISGGTVAGQPVNFSAGTTSGNLGSVVFSNSNGVSFGLNGSTITASAAAGGGGAAISAGTQSTNGGTVVFSNSNNVSFGMSNSSIVTASASYVSTVGLYALGNTTQNSSTTLDQRTQSFNALGAVTVGFSNGSIQVSAPATSSLSATGGLSISTNGSTISIGQAAVSRTIWPVGNLTAVSAPGNASMSFQYFPCDNALTASRMDALVGWTAGSSATTNTCAIAISAYGAIYTRNGASLSSLSSGSTQTTYSYASNSAGRTELQVGAIRPISIPMNVNMTQGEYFVGFNMVTATSSIGLSTTNCPQTFSVMGGNALQSALNYGEIGSATNASVGLYSGMGVYSAASTGLAAALSISGIVQTGASLSQANFGFVLRNA